MKNRLVYFYLIIIAFYGCANPQPPPGGPPDKTPPEVVGVEPANNTINFKGNTVTFKFSEYLRRENMSENIFVSPRTDIDLDWSGKDLDVEFLTPLLENTTYAITLGTDYTDLSQNKPAQAYTLIFSTGSVIDTGLISGIVVDREPAGAYVFAYRLDGINPDTLDPRRSKPQYLTQTGSNGRFDIHALKQGRYRVFAVRDQYKDGIYDEGTDAFGAPKGDVTVALDTPFVKMRLGPPIDKTAPQLFNAEAVSSRMIALNISEAIARASVGSRSFALTDSLGRDTVALNSAYISPRSASRIEILTSRPLDTTKTWAITALTAPAVAVRDTSGNIVSDTANKVYFQAVSNPETTAPEISRSPLADSSLNVDPMDTLTFSFNIGLVQQSLESSLSLSELPDSSRTLAFRTGRLADNEFAVLPAQRLKGDAWYLLRLSGRGVAGGNGVQMKDTTVKLRFKTADIRTYSSVSGSVRDSLGCGGPYVVILRNTETNKAYKTMTDKTNNWIFREMPPGSYSIEAFCDSDSNGVYSYGYAWPFAFGERFVFIDKPLTVRARWNTENTIIEMNQ